jgi:hypothetical protein
MNETEESLNALWAKNNEAEGKLLALKSQLSTLENQFKQVKDATASSLQKDAADLASTLSAVRTVLVEARKSKDEMTMLLGEWERMQEGHILTHRAIVNALCYLIEYGLPEEWKLETKTLNKDADEIARKGEKSNHAIRSQSSNPQRCGETRLTAPSERQPTPKPNLTNKDMEMIRAIRESTCIHGCYYTDDAKECIPPEENGIPNCKREIELILEALEATDAKRDARLATLLNDLLELAPEVDYVADQISEVGDTQGHRLSQFKYERTMNLLAKLGGRMRRTKAEIADALDATADTDKRNTT